MTLHGELSFELGLNGHNVLEYLRGDVGEGCTGAEIGFTSW